LASNSERLLGPSLCSIGLQTSEPYLQLGIGPPRDLNDHVQHRLLLIRIQRDIVERGHWLSIFLDEGAELESVWGTDFADAEFRGLLAV
jgi:hypothetical protein